MSHHQTNEIEAPTVVDVEASGFGRASYPIEVGFVLPNGHSFCSLIYPEPEWTHWDPQAETIHHISRELLLKKRSSRLRSGASAELSTEGSNGLHRWLGQRLQLVGPFVRRCRPVACFQTGKPARSFERGRGRALACGQERSRPRTRAATPPRQRRRPTAATHAAAHLGATQRTIEGEPRTVV